MAAGPMHVVLRTCVGYERGPWAWGLDRPIHVEVSFGVENPTARHWRHLQKFIDLTVEWANADELLTSTEPSASKPDTHGGDK